MPNKHEIIKLIDKVSVGPTQKKKNRETAKLIDKVFVSPTQMKKHREIVKKSFVRFFKKYKPGSFKNTTEFIKKYSEQPSRFSLSDRAIIRLISTSTIPVLKAAGARSAVKLKDKKLQKLFIESPEPSVKKELAQTENPEISLALIKDPKTSGAILDRISFNLFKNGSGENVSTSLKVILAILRHPNVYRSTIHYMVYHTRNFYVISTIIKHPYLNGAIISSILKFNHQNKRILLLALKSKKATKSHYIFAARKSSDPEIIGLCASQKDPKVLEVLVKRGLGFELLLKNKDLPSDLLLQIAQKNQHNIALLKDAFNHPNGKTNVDLWKMIFKSSNAVFMLDFFLKSRDPKYRLFLAKSYSDRLTDEQFKTLLYDPNSEVKNALRNNSIEKVRLRVLKYTQDKNFLLEKASNSRSSSEKVAIARRNKIPREVELSLIGKRNDEVYLALANRKVDILTETEKKLTETGNEKILIALSKRKVIKKVGVLKILANSGIEEVELSLLKRYKNPKILEAIVNKTKSFKVLLLALKSGSLELRIAVANRNYNFQKPLLKLILPELLKDSKPLARAALLTNRTFLVIVWEILHDKKKQNSSNPYYYAYRKLQLDQNTLVKTRFSSSVSRLKTAKKGEIKRWVFRKLQ